MGAGMRPLHVAILNSNPYFIKHICSLGILKKEELNFGYRGENIFDLMMKENVSKETRIAVTDFILKYSDKEKEKLIEEINSGKSVYQGEAGNRILDIIISKDLSDILEYVFNKGKVKDVEELFV